MKILLFILALLSASMSEVLLDTVTLEVRFTRSTIYTDDSIVNGPAFDSIHTRATIQVQRDSVVEEPTTPYWNYTTINFTTLLGGTKLIPALGSVDYYSQLRNRRKVYSYTNVTHENAHTLVSASFDSPDLKIDSESVVIAVGYHSLNIYKARTRHFAKKIVVGDTIPFKVTHQKFLKSGQVSSIYYYGTAKVWYVGLAKKPEVVSLSKVDRSRNRPSSNTFNVLGKVVHGGRGVREVLLNGMAGKSLEPVDR